MSYSKNRIDKETQKLIFDLDQAPKRLKRPSMDDQMNVLKDRYINESNITKEAYNRYMPNMNTNVSNVSDVSDISDVSDVMKDTNSTNSHPDLTLSIKTFQHFILNVCSNFLRALTLPRGESFIDITCKSIELGQSKPPIFNDTMAKYVCSQLLCLDSFSHYPIHSINQNETKLNDIVSQFTTLASDIKELYGHCIIETTRKRLEKEKESGVEAWVEKHERLQEKRVERQHYKQLTPEQKKMEKEEKEKAKKEELKQERKEKTLAYKEELGNLMFMSNDAAQRIIKLMNQISTAIKNTGDNKDVLSFIQSMNHNTLNISGTKFNPKEEKLVCLFIWVISALTDWLETTSVYPSDIKGAIFILCHDSPKEILNDLMTPYKENNILADRLFNLFAQQDLYLHDTALSILCGAFGKIANNEDLLDKVLYIGNFFYKYN